MEEIKEFYDNCDFSEEWILKELIKEHDKKEKTLITIDKESLFKLILKFLKLNKKGGL